MSDNQIPATTEPSDLSLPRPGTLPAEPYPGLRAFEPNEWTIFFGREPMIDEVITRLLSRRIIVVHGSSGCGKSSLIRAGVLPWLELEQARGEIGWKTGLMRPGDYPLHNLGVALANSLGAPTEQTDALPDAEWHQCVVVGGARDAISRRLGSTARLCLLIDQFEELFRFSREGGREEAELFVEWICEHAREPIPGLFLILTMRSDYIGWCAQFDGFAEEVDRCQYLLPRMDNLALLRAINEPARLFGGKVDPLVADRLLSAARRDEDLLPILQHTLMRACARSRERQRLRQFNHWSVTANDVKVVEGEYGALLTHAEEVLGKATEGNRELLRVAEWLFRGVADMDSQGQIVRRPCRLGELTKIANAQQRDMERVIETFRGRDCSFLMPPPGEPLDAETMIDVGHEALLRQWRRLSDATLDPETRELKGWLPREIEEGRQWQFLVTMAQAFSRDPSATLPPAMRAPFDQWLSSHNPAWAARYARQAKDAGREYEEVERLLAASRRKAKREQIWRAAGTCAIPAVGLLVPLLGLTGTGRIRDAAVGAGAATVGALFWRVTIVAGILLRQMALTRLHSPIAQTLSIPIAQTVLTIIAGGLAGWYGLFGFSAESALHSGSPYIVGGIFGSELMEIIALRWRRPRRAADSG